MPENKWIEIISVRLSRADHTETVKEIIDHIRSGRCPDTGKEINASLYVNRELELDWSIHLVRDRKDGSPRKTLLGSGIADMFAGLGLVNHSVWKHASF